MREENIMQQYDEELAKQGYFVTNMRIGFSGTRRKIWRCIPMERKTDGKNTGIIRF